MLLSLVKLALKHASFGQSLAGTAQRHQCRRSLLES